MNIRDVLIEEGGRLDEVIAMAMEDLKKAPEGGLATRTIGGKVYFYMNIHAKTVYLSRNRDMASIRALAQKAYARKVLKAACRQKAILDRFLADYDPQAVSGIFIDGRHDGLFTPYLDKPLEDEPLSFSPVPAVDIELVFKLKDICSRLLEG